MRHYRESSFIWQIFSETSHLLEICIEHNSAREIVDKFKMLPFLVLVVLVCGTSASKQQERRILPFPPRYPPIYPPFYNLNATGAYNYATEKCCLGNISPANRYSRCCGNQTYDTTRQLCCQNEVRPIQIGYACCGKDTFNTEKEFCCNGNNIVSMPDTINAYTMCCGNKTFDSSKQRCCYANGKPAIVDSKSPNSDGCCGDKAMNYQTEICCVNNKVNPANYTVFEKKNRNAMCCNNEVIDNDRQGCCNDTVYDNSINTCCFTNSGSVVTPLSKKGGACCGISGKTYDPENEICCLNEVIKKTNDSTACCGNQTYNAKEEICCYGTKPNVVKKNSPDQTACCGDKAYSLNIEGCCSNYNDQYAVYKYNEETCCGYKVYKQKGICCNDKNGTQIFLETNSTSSSCCGSKPYSYLTQICCGEYVYDQSESKTCCIDKPYDLNTQTCCTNYDSTTRTFTGNVLDQKEVGKTCCGSKLISYSDGEFCCGNQVYDTKNQTCCGNKLLYSDGQKTSCCGDQVYDTKKQTCCGNKLFDSNGQKTSCCYPYATDYQSPCPYPIPMNE